MHQLALLCYLANFLLKCFKLDPPLAIKGHMASLFIQPFFPTDPVPLQTGFSFWSKVLDVNRGIRMANVLLCLSSYADSYIEDCAVYGELPQQGGLYGGRGIEDCLMNQGC